MTAHRLLPLGVWLLGAAVVNAGPLVSNGQSDYCLVTADQPAAADATAARELQAHLQAVTGASLPIRPASQAPPTKRIVVGDSPLARRLAPEVDPAALRHDGIVLRTVGDDLLLLGRAPRGTLYAVYTFLEDVVGCRWWTATESYTPRRPTLELPALNINYAPALRTRETFYRDAQEGVFSARNKLNGHFHRVAPDYGGHYSILGWCHTFYQLLPPEQYFAAHPEWYSELNGKRVAEGGQLCLANAAMRAELVKQALAWIAKNPSAGMISISQNDWHGRCQCAECRAAEAAEGSPSGPLVRFVNAVADEIGKQYPDFLIETLAYQYTRTPPKLVRPRDNVVIRLCTIECSYAQPLVGGAQNETFRRDIEGWSAIAPKLYIWDYVTNFANFLLPHPNYGVLDDNIRTFVANKAVGLFEQGDAYSTTGDFVRLRAWVLSKLMWDPLLDQEALTAEFLRGYYGAAAPHLQAYLTLLTRRVETAGTYLRCYMNDTAAWLDLPTANEATRLLDAASTAVAGDATLTQRVRRERLPLDLAWLDRGAAFRRRAAGQPSGGPADLAAAYAEYKRLQGEYQNGFYGEGRPLGPWLEALGQRFAPSGPPPELCRDLPAEDWIDAQEGLLTLHGLGNWVSLVDDPAASNGKAAAMPATHNQWAVQWPLGADLDDGRPWHIYVLARIEGPATDGEALQVGLYDGPGGKGLVSRTVPTTAVRGEQYRLLDLGATKLTAGCYVWVAPLANPQQVSRVLVDRMFLIRER
ncbi:MAG: DUF4838 domain-containing protein [Fimbriimonadaceae bacterium]|nr:DUF4838 domain-containing protein [Fimbriimonadaceae bacterium]